MKKDFMEQIVDLLAADKLAEVYEKDEEYRKRLKEDNLLYGKLKDALTNEQAELLEEYFTSALSSSSRKETLAYTQGMKDLLSFLKYLSK